MLTQKQKDLLMFINDRLNETGVPPSFDEMKDALSLKSKSGIHRLITALEERGFIRRLPHRARALDVLKLPGDNEARGGTPSAAGLRLIEGGRGAGADSPAPSSTIVSDSTVSVPVMGRIAGHVYAIERHEELAGQARAREEQLGYDNVKIICADGTKGWPDEAPFDAIVVSAGGTREPIDAVRVIANRSSGKQGYAVAAEALRKLGLIK